MEGYSVTEAASILGVPTERVWELLARGVLSGAPEGDTGMRVYLQPRPAPAPPAAEAGRPNGDSNQAEQRELSPFRELLTEFRNLTERYGQALLALGEARGEVAALRSRVDLLEARMDLRLPMAPAGLPDPGWGTGQMERAATPAPAPAAAHARPDRDRPPPIPHAEEAEATEEDHDRPSGRRRSAHRRATDAFAEALARADDPTRPELPGAAETAAAMAAIRDHDVAEAQETQAEAMLPRELPAADSIPSADEEPAPTPGARAEPRPAPEPQPEHQPEPEPQPEAKTQSEPEPQPEEPMSREADAPEPVATESPVGPEEPPEPEPSVVEVAAPIEDAVESVVLLPEPVSVLEPGAAEVAPGSDTEADGGSAEAAPVTVVEPAAAAHEEAEPPPPIDWDPDRYTVVIEEPDWFAGEVADDEPRKEPVASSPPDTERPEHEPDLETKAELGPEVEVEPGREMAAAAAPDPAGDAAHPSETTPEPAAEAAPVSAAEETMLWFGRAVQERAPASSDDGADEMEVAGGGRGAEGRSMPGARELDDALAALDALARGAEPPAPSKPEPTPPAEPEPEKVLEPVARPPAAAWPAMDAPPARAEDPWTPPEPAAGAAPDRASVTPASRAYRRLRRIFPG